MSSSRITRCSFCRLLVNYVQRRSLHELKTGRKPELLLTRSIARPLSTTHIRYREAKDDGNMSESSDSSSDSSSSDSDSDTETPAGTSQLSPGSLLSKLNEKPTLLNELKGLQTSGSRPEPESISDLIKRVPKKSASAKTEKDTAGSDSLSKRLNQELLSAVEKVVDILPGDKKESESALIGQLLTQFKTTEDQKSGKPPQDDTTQDKSFSGLMEGFTITKTFKHQDERSLYPGSMGEIETVNMEEQYRPRSRGSGLFNGEPLGIFTKEDMEQVKTDGKKSLFEIVAEEEKAELLTYPARNAFEEQIQWTREGKFWTFPIDNEAGWEEEKNVGFQEHVFLDHKLVDFPKKGPIRHFMELVSVALSKNPYLTVQQKHEHIDWFKDYFQEKQELLEEHLGQDGVIKNNEKQAIKENES